MFNLPQYWSKMHGTLKTTTQEYMTLVGSHLFPKYTSSPPTDLMTHFCKRYNKIIFSVTTVES